MSLDARSLHIWQWLSWFRKTPPPAALPTSANTTNLPPPPTTWVMTETATPTTRLPTTGEVLRRLRKARGLTQAEVSALTYALPGRRGISPSSVSAVELWHSNLEPATVESYLLAMEQWGA